jgi:hypothetical protein
MSESVALNKSIPTHQRPRLDNLSRKEESAEPEFFEEIDNQRSTGRGSCCTLWSFYLLFATLIILAGAVILWLR